MKMTVLDKSDSFCIREVWADNLEHEMELIQEIVDQFPYLAMDTEFPGTVMRSIGNFETRNDYHYQNLRLNVNLLKLIQLGLTFSDGNGNLPTCGTDKFCVWQFNFREFNLEDDIFADESIDLLSRSGIDFKKNNKIGIDALTFSEMLMSSGVVMNDEVHWVTFHSGYDFGYLVKLLTGNDVPETQSEFFVLVRKFFPNVYDIKYLMRYCCANLHGGLSKVAEILGVPRIGVSHQAGSDSLLTSYTFLKIKEMYFSESHEKYSGNLYGLGCEA